MKIRRMALALCLSAGLVGAPAAAMAATVTGSVYGPPGPSSFSDVSSSNPAYNAITEDVKAGLFQGFPGGQFKPNAPVSSAQVITVLVRLAGFNKDALALGGSKWYSGYEEEAIKLGILTSSGTVSNAPTSRLDTFMFLAFALQFTPATGTYPFPNDQSKVPTADQGYILALYKAGYLKGSGNGDLNPTGTLTRADFAILVARILNA